MSVRVRSWAAGLVAGGAAVVVWLAAGAPWWVPVLLLAGALGGRLVAAVLPARLRGRAVGAGVAASALWLVVHTSLGAVLIVLGAALLALALVATPATVGRQGPAAPVARARHAVGTVAGLLLIAGLVVIGIEQIRQAAEREQIDQQAGDYARAQLLPASPARAIRALLVAIGEDDPAVVCSAFTQAAAAQLAAAQGAVDCPGAIHALHAEVVDSRRYTSPDRASTSEQLAPDGQTGSGDGCRLTWTGLPQALQPGTSAVETPPPGPQPGVLQGQRQLGQGFRIVDYRPCPSTGH